MSLDTYLLLNVHLPELARRWEGGNQALKDTAC